MTAAKPSSAELSGIASALHALAVASVPAALLARDPAAVKAFADEHGHRLHTDPFLLASALDAPWPPAFDPRALGDTPVWALAGSANARPDAALAPGDAAPLVRHPDLTSIEVSTEVELSALHALWRAARVRARDDLTQRCLRAAAWHVEHLQPDNATHRPWAVHVFYLAWAATGDWSLRHHADTQVHNTRVAAGTPDTRSGLILLDAARELLLAIPGVTRA